MQETTIKIYPNENFEGAEVSKLAWELRAARESQRSGWQESPSSSSGIDLFFAVVRPTHLT